MKNKLLHTPEGVRDIYNEECEKKLVLQDKINHTLKSFGYRSIQTPTFEFFDIFGKEIGTTPSKELYKFFDRQGNTLVLRPDITPSIARFAAKYFDGEDLPARLSYMGNTFINNHSYQGRLKECTQIGAELIGDKSVDADAEILSMAVHSLKASGLREFQISVGHVGILSGMMSAAGLDEEQEERIRELIANKNFFGVAEEVEEAVLDDNLKKLFSMIGNIYNSAGDFAAAKELSRDYPQIAEALERLVELDKVLKIYGVDPYISYELGMLGNYSYYTGIIFAGYTFGSGERIVKGGRYDKLLPYFGKEAASIGFAFTVDQLMLALSRQGIEIALEHNTQLIVYRKESQKKAIETAVKLRKNNCHVELMRWDETKTKADYEAYRERNKIVKLTFMEGTEADG